MRSALAIAAFVTLAALSGCGGYAAWTRDFHGEVDRGDLEGALDEITGLIEETETPAGRHRADLPLLLLERASIHQALDDHERAVADFTDADSMLEILELTPDRIGPTADYLWSDSAGLYRAPVYEKLMVNISALASYLALGRTDGARVEARRIRVLTDFWANTQLAGHPMIGAASFMAGLAFELSGERESALRYYLDAADIGPAPGLDEAIARLAARSSLLGTTEVRDARERLGLESTDPAPEPPAQEVIAIVLSGQGPRRQPEHYPIGVVIEWFRQDARYELSDRQQSQLDRATAENLLTWVNYPVLVPQPSALEQVTLHAGGGSEAVSLIADIESFALSEWAAEQPAIAFAAVIRALTRVVAREAVQAVGDAVEDAQEEQSGEDAHIGAIFWLVSLILQGGMQAADVPDTRTWTMIPARLSIARLPVDAGEQEVVVNGWGRSGSVTRSWTVDVPEGGTAVVVARLLD